MYLAYLTIAHLTMQQLGRVQQMGPTTPDAAGGWTPSWSDVFAPVWVRLEDASAARVEQFARQEMNITHEIFTMTRGIRVGMRFVNSANGRPYLIGGDITEYATGRIPTYFHFVCEEQRSLNDQAATVPQY
jgi:head-tail joining protein